MWIHVRVSERARVNWKLAIVSNNIRSLNNNQITALAAARHTHNGAARWRTMHKRRRTLFCLARGPHCWMSDLHEICNKRAYSGTFLRASWWWIIIIFALGRAPPPRTLAFWLLESCALVFMPIHPALKFTFHPFISHLRHAAKLLRLANKVTLEICTLSNLIREENFH